MEDVQPIIVQKKTRSCRLTKEQTDQKLNEIYQELLDHRRKPALMYIKDGRDMLPYFVIISKRTGRFSFEALQRCYDPNGKFRCYLSHSIDIISIMTGEQKIIFFDEGI